MIFPTIPWTGPSLRVGGEYGLPLTINQRCQLRRYDGTSVDLSANQVSAWQEDVKKSSWLGVWHAFGSEYWYQHISQSPPSELPRRALL